MDPHSFILPAVFFKCGSWSGPRYRFHHEKLQLTWIQFQIPVSGSESGSAFKKNLWIRIRKKTKKNADPQPGSAIVFLSTTFCFGCGSWSGHGYRIYKKNFSCFSFYFPQILAKMNMGSRFRCPDPDQDPHKKNAGSGTVGKECGYTTWIRILFFLSPAFFLCMRILIRIRTRISNVSN